MDLNATDEQCAFIGIAATAIAPYLFEGGGRRLDAAAACARLAGSILGELVESDGVSYADYPRMLEDMKLMMVDEFDKFISAGGAKVQ